MKSDLIKTYRYFLKDSVRKTIDFSQTDQHQGIAPPPIQKEYGVDQKLIALPEKETWNAVKNINVLDAIQNRESRRQYTRTALELDELAFLLWATQGVKEVIQPGCALRTVPSAGCRHSFETYLVVLNVSGLDEGIYRYLPIDNSLVLEDAQAGLAGKAVSAAFGQSFVGDAAAVFVWTTMPYRMEWRYDIAAHRVIAMDAGHVCQNLYLACEAIDSGTCAIAAFDQDEMDELIGVDGENEFVVYMAPVGKVI